jgi:hypothetical protein
MKQAVFIQRGQDWECSQIFRFRLAIQMKHQIHEGCQNESPAQSPGFLVCCRTCIKQLFQILAPIHNYGVVIGSTVLAGIGVGVSSRSGIGVTTGSVGGSAVFVGGSSVGVSAGGTVSVGISIGVLLGHGVSVGCKVLVGSSVLVGADVAVNV